VIRVVVDDLAFVEVDAVVRPATAALAPTSPALRRLEQVGGPAFWKPLKVHDALDVGAAVVTGAGDLAAEFVIHAVIWSDAEPVSIDGIRRALVSVLQRAADWQLERIAVPPLGTGPGGLGLEDVAATMIDLLSAIPVGSCPTDVAIVVETEDERRMFEARLGSITQ
jgi:O-acetyl-ADP-ribose deacetylase (regulator of RNase III)